MKKIILGLALSAAALMGCEPKEKVAALQYQVDSLTVQLATHLEIEANINEVGALIDSIDASRHALQLTMIEGNSSSTYLTRLKKINEYVKSAEVMMIALEKNRKASKVSASTIRGLKADLEKRSKEILDLQLRIAELSDANMALWLKVNEKDSILFLRDQAITLNKNDIAWLEKRNIESQEENKIVVANLYFDQASAVELVADRTRFAPRRKKAARMWALDLFRLSHSLGNKAAQARIEKLEKKIS